MTSEHDARVAEIRVRMESVWEHGFISTDPREADLYQLGVVDAHWLLSQLAASEAATARLVEAGSRLFACVDTTRDVWLSEDGGYEIACACCGRHAVGTRDQQAVIEHAMTCDVLAWRTALAVASGQGGAGEGKA